MHLAVLADHERLLHEGPMLDRLCAGLEEHEVRVTRIGPPSPGPPEPLAEPKPDRLEAPLKVLPWMRSARTERLAESFERTPPDLIYAVGEHTWGLAMDLAARLERLTVIDVWSSSLVRRLPWRRSAAHVGAYVAWTEPIAAALRRRRLDPGLVSLVRPGVPVPEAPRAILASPQSIIALAIIGSGRDMPAYRAMLGGFGRIAKDHPQVQGFIELRGPHDHEIWRLASRLDLLGQLSSLTDAAHTHPLLTQCDALLIPERYGDVRSLMLEAMALGMPVVAGEDAALDMLRADETAYVVSRTDPETWAQQLARLMTTPEDARTVGLAGRRIVAEHYRTTDHIDGLVTTFRHVLSGGAYSFASERAARQ